MEYDLANAGREWPTFLAHGGFAAKCARANVAGSGMTRHGRAMTWQVDATATTEPSLPVFAFPALEPSVNGHVAAWPRDPATGLIVMSLPAGPAVVAVTWRLLPPESAGLGLSALTAAVLAGISLQRRWRTSREPGIKAINDPSD